MIWDSFVIEKSVVISFRNLPLIYSEIGEPGPRIISIPQGFDVIAALAEAHSIDKRTLITCRFRGVSLDRLHAVVDSGVDVVPTDAPIFAANFAKAWEYGDLPKVMLAYDCESLERTFEKVPVDSPAHTLAALRERYPTVIEVDDGASLWFTHFNESDTRAASPYEVAHAYHIPGDPFEALRAILIFARPSDRVLERMSELAPTRGAEHVADANGAGAGG